MIVSRRLSLVVATVGQAVPAFVIAILLILLFAVNLRWLPAGGFGRWDGMVLPVAALAVLADDTLRLHGRVIALDGSRLAEGRESARIHEVPDAEQLGTALAARLIREGAAEILAEVRAVHAPSVTEP